MTYKDICDALLSKKLIVDNNGKYELSKSLGNPQKAIQSVEEVLSGLIGTNTTQNSDIDEAGDLPAGAENDVNAPWNQNQKDATTKAKEKVLSVLAYNRESAILKGVDGSLYFFFYDHINREAFKPYAKVERTFIGKDETGEPEYEYSDNFVIDDNVLDNYVNDNINEISKGEGLGGFNSGADLVKIDAGLKQELLLLYDKDKSFVKILSSIQEMTSAASSGAFTAPLTTGVVKKEMPIDSNKLDVPVVGETTAGSASVGAYDANALPNINRDGSFKETEKPKAFKKTQYAGGGFVKLDKCTKLNNNKSAQNGKCSQGGVDKVVKVTKTAGNINAPSLNESPAIEGENTI